MDTKSIILQTALDLFYSKGYDAVGVQEIATKSGITKPTLYYYFGSKLGLLTCLLEEYSIPLIKQLEQASITENIQQALLHTAKIFCDFSVSHQKFYRLMLSLMHCAPDNEAYITSRPIWVRINELFVRIFQENSDALGNMNGRQQQFAIGLVGLLNHYLLLKFEQSPDNVIILTQEELEGLLNQFMYGIFS